MPNRCSFNCGIECAEVHIDQDLELESVMYCCMHQREVHFCSRAVLSGSDSPDAWDKGCVGTPCPVSMAGGTWRLYYSGRQSIDGGPWGGIGMALTEYSSNEFEGIKV